MRRMLPLILALLFIIALAGGGNLGIAKFNLPDPSSETSVKSIDEQPYSDHADFRFELASADLPGSPRHADVQLVAHLLPHTLQIIDCSHLSSSGGIPL